MAATKQDKASWGCGGLRVLALAAIVLALLVAHSGEAWAERRVALVIGNGAYGHAPALRNPGNDAEGIAALLGTLGFEVESGRDLGLRAMEALIRRFGRLATGADVALVFYAGHGLQVDGENWLLPVDARLEDVRDLEFEAVNLTTVLRQVEGSAARIVMLDACRDNPLAAQMQMAGGTRSVGRGLARVETADVGTLIAFATSPGATAADGSGRHSPFTAALLEHLAKPGLEIRQAMTRVRQSVVTASNGRQTPWENASLTGEIYLAGLPAGTAPVLPPAPMPPTAGFDERALELALWEAIKDSNSPEAFQAYLTRFPEGTFATVARLRLADLEKLALGIFPPAEEPTPDSCQGGVVTRVSGEQRCLRPGDTFRDCPQCPEMVVVPAGRFTIGSPASEKARLSYEGPQHEVTIPAAFAVGRFEVTRGQFAAFAAESGYQTNDMCWTQEGGEWKVRSSRTWRNPGFEQTNDHPVACVSWNDGKAYVGWLSQKTDVPYRLLSEAEWEYAARAGTTTPFSTGATITTDQANFDGNHTYGGSRKGTFRRKTVEVGSFAPNPFGLHDMHGNVWEWVEDCWNDSHPGVPGDGSARTSGHCSHLVLRGGSWVSGPVGLRSAFRNGFDAGYRNFSVGLRVSRTLAPAD